MAGKTKVSGTAYTISSGKTKVDGTGYAISKGKTKVSGTVYDITFSNPVTVSITSPGAYGASSNYYESAVVYGSDMHTTVGSFEIEHGEQLLIAAKSADRSHNICTKLNGTAVGSTSTTSFATIYTYTVPNNVSAISIALVSGRLSPSAERTVYVEITES